MTLQSTSEDEDEAPKPMSPLSVVSTSNTTSVEPLALHTLASKGVKVTSGLGTTSMAADLVSLSEQAPVP